MKRRVLFGMLLLVVSLLAVPAGASTIIYLRGVNYPTEIFATVQFDYVGVDDGVGKINLKISNTSLITAALTAFAFNSPNAVIGPGDFSGPSGWKLVYNPDAINTPGNFGFLINCS